jgi:hypothetical protein
MAFENRMETHASVEDNIPQIPDTIDSSLKTRESRVEVCLDWVRGKFGEVLRVNPEIEGIKFIDARHTGFSYQAGTTIFPTRRTGDIFRIRAVMAILTGEAVIECIPGLPTSGRSPDGMPFNNAEHICTILMQGVDPLEAVFKAQAPYSDHHSPVADDTVKYALKGAALLANFFSRLPTTSEHEREKLRVLTCTIEASLNAYDIVTQLSSPELPRKRGRPRSKPLFAIDEDDHQRKRRATFSMQPPDSSVSSIAVSEVTPASSKPQFKKLAPKPAGPSTSDESSNPRPVSIMPHRHDAQHSLLDPLEDIPSDAIGTTPQNIF